MRKFVFYCTVFALCYFKFESSVQLQDPEGLNLDGRFNGGFFALRVRGAFIWRDLYMEGLILMNVRKSVVHRQRFCFDSLLIFAVFVAVVVVVA